MKNADPLRRARKPFAALLAALAVASAAALGNGNNNGNNNGGAGNNVSGGTGGNGGSGGANAAAAANSDWTGSGWTGGRNWGDSYSGTAPAATRNSRSSSSSGQQHMSGGDGANKSPAADPSSAKGAADEPAKSDDADDRPRALSLADAREDFTTVVTTYIEKLSDKGYWPWTEKGRTWRLEYVSVADASVRKKGRGLYAGLVTLRDVRTRKKLALEFTVDFSKPVWEVAAIKRPGAKARK